MVRTSRPRGSAPESGDQPLVINGWSLHIWTDLAERWSALRVEVERLRSRDPVTYVREPATKMLAMLSALMFKEIPEDPGAKEYLQGRALGKRFSHWRRAKFFQRFRLFFRYSSERKIVVYVWVNDENTLRKAGARTDPYAVFAAMLARGVPPDDFDALVEASRRLKTRDSDQAP